MSPLWTDIDAALATGGQATSPFTAFNVSIDTRKLEVGDLFIALRGDHNDGHEHLSSAQSAGAVAAIVDVIPDDAPKELSYLIVDDTLQALTDLAMAARSRLKGKVVAITGSVGKTGAKDGLAHVLEPFGSVHKTIGNLNNHFGCPLTLARMPADTTFAIIELGMNHANEIAPLSRLARPDIALITTVDAVHLEFFNSVAEIADAKSEIFAGLGENGIAVLNRDNPHFQRMVQHAKAAGISEISTFGESSNATFRLAAYACNGVSSDISAICNETRVGYQLGAAGRHLALNSLAILAVVSALGIDIEKAAKLFATLNANPGRGGRYEIQTCNGTFVLIDESYNASPASTTAALQVLSDTPVGRGGRRIAVLGDMLELGKDGPNLHKSLARIVEQSKIDLVFTAGPMMAELFDALPKPKRGGHAANSGEILPVVSATVRAGDVITVKGSLGSRMKPVVDALLALNQSGLEDHYEPVSTVANGGCG